MEIVGYPNYLIYEDGRVFSKNRNKFMEIDTHKNGYKRIQLWTNKKAYHKLVHRLVATAYIPNDDNKPCVDHIDRDTTNNHFSNLRWVTHLENQQNLGDNRSNTSGYKNISRHRNSWKFQKLVNGTRHIKNFKTLEEAIEYKTQYLKLVKI